MASTSSMQKGKPNGKGTLSLLDFAHNKRADERKKTCAICRLPAEVKAEIKVARARKVERSTVIEWLKTLKYQVDDLDFQTHNAGLHDQRDTRGPQ